MNRESELNEYRMFLTKPERFPYENMKRIPISMCTQMFSFRDTEH